MILFLKRFTFNSLIFQCLFACLILIFSPVSGFANGNELIIKFKSPDSLHGDEISAKQTIILNRFRNQFGDFQKRRLIPKNLKSGNLRKAGKPHPFSSVLIVRFKRDIDAMPLINRLNASPEIEYACQNHVFHVHQIVNDPEFSKQWGLKRIGIKAAWEKTRGSGDMPIVVIDTGIDMQHEDLQGQIWVNQGEDLNQNGIADSADYNGIDDDGNGYTDDIVGWDFVDAPNYPDNGDYRNPDNAPLDENGHGTAIAGIVAAKSGNGLGIAGVAPDCQVVNLRAGTSQGLLEEDDVAAAVLYAVDMGFRIINMSFGDVLIRPLLRDVIKYAYQNNVVMIASSGNSGDDHIHYPSGLAEVISVGAIGETGYRANFSSYGSTLDLVAPGVSIFTTRMNNRHGNVSGTSASAPFVSGVSALLLTLHPDMSTGILRDRILFISEDLGDTGWDYEYGAGLLRADMSLSDVGNATVQITSPAQDQGFHSNIIPIVGSCAGAWVSGYELAVGMGRNPVNWQILTQQENWQVLSDTIWIWYASEPADTIYTFRLRAHFRNGDYVDDHTSIFMDKSPPVISEFESLPIVYQNKIGYLYRFQTDEITRAEINYRPEGSTDSFKTEELQFENTVHANIMLDSGKGDIEFYFKAQNKADLVSRYPDGQSYLQMSFQDHQDILQPLWKTNAMLNAGYLFRHPTDFDTDGNPEIVMNQYEGNDNFGSLVYWEFENGQFHQVYHTDRRLIPRDVGDVNGDDRLDMLTGAGGAVVILTADGSNHFPNTVAWFDTNDVWAGRFHDFNNDTYPELLAKVGNTWKLWRNHQDYSFTEYIDLPNETDGENGTGVPHVEIGDFDSDQEPELLFGDYDGDIYLYKIRSDLSAEWVWSDRLPMIDAIDFIVSGDYDGDGQLEFAAGCHSKEGDIDLEHQFDERHWLFRIYDHTATNYECVWEQRFYKYRPPKEFDSGLSSEDIDGDHAEELLISISPNFYIVEYDTFSDRYVTTGHHSPIRSNQAVALDHDGQKHILFNNGSECRLYEYKKSTNGAPLPPISFQAIALDSQTVQLNWINDVPPDTFRIYRGTHPDSLRLYVSHWAQKEYLDSLLTKNQTYWYQVSRIPNQGAEIFSGIESATPHDPARITNIRVCASNQMVLNFSLPMGESVQERKHFTIRSTVLHPSTVAQSQDLREAVLTWGDDVELPESDTLLVKNLSDSSGTPLDNRDRKRHFFASGVRQEAPYIVRAEFRSQNRLQVEFSQPMETTSVLAPKNYHLEPDIAVESVTQIESNGKTVDLKLQSERPVGPIGIQYDLYITGVRSRDGILINQEIGYRITFLFIAKDLSNVYVYPNPAKTYLKFARLTSRATIEIFNSSGILVEKLDVKTNNGGFEWDLRDEHDHPVPSGIYIYRVFHKSDSHWGKLAVVR